MTRTDGGARAASGLFYQYLFTIESFATMLEEGWPTDSAIWIEESSSTESLRTDIIDFEIRHPQDGIIEVHQAKSVMNPASTTISAADALIVLAPLSRSIDCPRYILTTNARPGRDIATLTSIFDAARDPETLSDTEFLAPLGELAANSTLATTELASISSPEAIARLRRCQVVATGETADIVRDRIRQRIRDWRSTHGLALGDAAATLLENSVITAIFERAAGTLHPHLHRPGVDMRELTLHKFTELLAHSRHLLTEATGIDETSAGLHHVPSGEGIARTELIDEIALRFGNLRAGQALRCALTGKSGIGKSRLAAMFAHIHRQAYDRVCWIDSESEASVHASVVTQRHTLGLDGQEQRPIHELAASFRESVATSPGRWLIVFDNARTPAEIEQWLPHTTAAHILATSNNEVGWTAFSRVKVERMTDEQACTLLRSRLETDDPTADITPAETKIVRKFDGWPLALQLVAAHFGSLSALTHGTETYLAQISDYVIDDPELDHDGYPRTLQAAIHMCLDRLASRAANTNDIAAVNAWDMLTVGSVFASHAIPDVLLYAVASGSAPSIRENRGHPILVDDNDLPKISRAIHRIRTESLVDRSISADEQIPMPMRAQVEINDIIQRIIRNRESTANLIDKAAIHLSAYLDYYLRNKQYTEAILIQPHALSVLEHSTTALYDLDTPQWCATLAGNQATFLDVQARSAEATPWLEFEMAILRQGSHHSPRLIAKTSHQLVLNKNYLGMPRNDILPHAIDGIEALEESARFRDLEWEAGTVLAGITQWIDISLGGAEFSGVHEPALQDLKDRSQRLAAVFPTDELTRNDPTSLINELVKSGHDEEALAVADAALDAMPQHEHLRRLPLSATRLEILAYLRRFDEISHHLDRFVDDLDRNPQVRAGISTNLLNMSNTLSAALMFEGKPEAAPILNGVLGICRPILVNNYNKWCHAIHSAAVASFHNDREGVRIILDHCESQRPTTIPDTVWAIDMSNHLLEWLTFWLACADGGQSARRIEGTVAGFDYGLDELGMKSQVILIRISAADRNLLPKLKYYFARRRRAFGGEMRIIELRNPDTNAPFARIEINMPELIHSRAMADFRRQLDIFDKVILTTSDDPRSGPLAIFSE